MKTFASLHDEFEQMAPMGIAAAVSAARVQDLAREMLESDGTSASRGLNLNVPIAGAKGVAASWVTDPASFTLDGLAATASLIVEIRLHKLDDPSAGICLYKAEMKDVPVRAKADPSTREVYLSASRADQIDLRGPELVTGYEEVLIGLGYQDAGGSVDLTTFKEEVLYPLRWSLLRNLVAAILRSVPVPQPLAWQGAIQPVGEVQAAISDGYIVSWTEKARVAIPTCGDADANPVPPGTWASAHGVPLPWSRQDQASPEVVMYYSSTVLLTWHAEAVRPAVHLARSSPAVVAWELDASVSALSLIVTAVPGPQGGMLSGDVSLEASGRITAFLRLPCDLRQDIGTMYFTAPGAMSSKLDVAADKNARMLRASWNMTGSIDESHLEPTSGSLAFELVAEVVKTLTTWGVLRLTDDFVERGSLDLIDLDPVLGTERLEHMKPVAHQRVGRNSVAFAIGCEPLGSPERPRA